MKKEQIKELIENDYESMEKVILLAKLDYLKDGQSYAWMHGTAKMRLCRKNNSFSISVD